jgi:hypothetical protein
MAFDVEQQIQQLIGIYRQGFEEALRIIIDKDAKGQWTRYHKDLMLDIQAVLRQLDQHADQWIVQTVGQSYSQAMATTAAFLMGVGIAVAETPEFAQVHRRAIDVIAQNMSGNLRDATQFVGRTTHDTFRRVGLEATARKYAAGATVRDMKKEVIRRLVDQGQTAMIDRAGRRWRLDSYAEMVARTTTREAASVATLNTCREFGLDLVQISQHYPTCPLCAVIQGRAYSISGEDKRYPRYTDEVRIPKHPHCRHSVHPYVRELDDNAAAMERFSNQPPPPQSEAEMQAYKDARDKVTIATNRKRAREVLLSENAPMVEKVKAAERLKKTYEKAGTRPVGRDAGMIKQYEAYIDSLKLGKVVDINSKTGIITIEGRSVPRKAFPDAVVDLKHESGKIIQRRYFGHDGNARLDIDLTDHNKPWSHETLHVHEWIDGKRTKKWRKPTALEIELVNDL